MRFLRKDKLGGFSDQAAQVEVKGVSQGPLPAGVEPGQDTPAQVVGLHADLLRQQRRPRAGPLTFPVKLIKPPLCYHMLPCITSQATHVIPPL